jgi:hypothetical protein
VISVSEKVLGEADLSLLKTRYLYFKLDAIPCPNTYAYNL